MIGRVAQIGVDVPIVLEACDGEVRSSADAKPPVELSRDGRVHLEVGHSLVVVDERCPAVWSRRQAAVACEHERLSGGVVRVECDNVDVVVQVGLRVGAIPMIDQLIPPSFDMNALRIPNATVLASLWDAVMRWITPPLALLPTA